MGKRNSGGAKVFPDTHISFQPAACETLHPSTQNLKSLCFPGGAYYNGNFQNLIIPGPSSHPFSSMSPEVVDLRSSNNSPPPKPSFSVQNPNLVPEGTSQSPFNYTSFSYVNFSESGKSLNFSSGFDNAIGCGFATPFAPPGSAASGRSRPRLVKLRKQSASQHAKSRSRTAAAEVGSGFNPFRSVIGNSDQVGSSVSTSNGFMESSSEVQTGARTCNLSFLNCHLKFGDAGFVFGAKKTESATYLNGEGAAPQCTGEFSFINRGKVTTEQETNASNTNHVEFVFSAKWSGTESNSCQERWKTGENTAKTIPGDERKVKDESKLGHGKFSNTVFVFNAKQNYKDSNSNKEKLYPSKLVDNSDFDDVPCGKQDSFGFNLSGKTLGLHTENQESLDGTRKSDHLAVDPISHKTETNSNSNTHVHQDDHLSNNGKSNSIPSAYSGTPAFTLPDEIKNLNINDSQTVDSGNISTDLKNSRVKNDAAFVFGSRENCHGSFSTNSGNNFNGRWSHPHAAFEDIGGQYLNTFERNSAQNGTAGNNASDSAEMSSSEPSQEGIRDFYRGKIPETKVHEDSQVNHSTSSFSFSFGLDSHPNNNASTTHSTSTYHDNFGNGFTGVPEGYAVNFVDFKPPTWDPSCFKENLFPKLNKKIGSTQKRRSSIEKGSKHLGRKSKPQSLNKKQTKQDHLPKESRPPETPGSPGRYSRMDFSPYQDDSADDKCLKPPVEINEPLFPDHIYVPSSLQSTDPTDCEDEYVAGATAYAGVSFSSNTERQKTDQLTFAHGLGDVKEKIFAFSSPSTGEGISSSLRRKQKKKYRSKGPCESFVITRPLNGKIGSPVTMLSHSDVINRSENIDDQFKQGGVVYSAAIEETCDKWRLRGNQAYKDENFSKAEDFYTQGINSVPSSEMTGCQIKSLVLCYSNRAATRMGLGRIREALGDCLMATALDPTFLKARTRTAKCHLLLGEVENALQCFSKCLEPGYIVCLERRVTVKAAEGVHKVQKVAECINHSAELLKERTSDAAAAALELLRKALSISPYSDKLLQMKAEALYLLQKYNAAIQLCKQSQDLAEKNFTSADSVDKSNVSTSDNCFPVKLWRWSLISRCYFHLGSLETSLSVLDKLQDVSLKEKHVIGNIEDSLSLAATIRELLYHKNAGNEAFKSEKYAEALQHYTVALSSNVKSRPFAAICFCNRGATHQALGQIADAISDCSVAMALDGNYGKAISRRATLHEMVRDYGQAASDLKRLISVLENKSDKDAKQSGTPNGTKELRKAHQLLHFAEEKSKKGIPPDLYLILGIKQSAAASDIKKAYHKAALRHHPDKAGQLLSRREIGDEGQVWKEILQEVHKDADRLFKMIGEAYAVLSDPAKRSEYDLEETMRKAFKESNRGSPIRRSSEFGGYGRSSNVHRSPSDRSSNRRHGHGSWKTYGNSYSHW